MTVTVIKTQVIEVKAAELKKNVIIKNYLALVLVPSIRNMTLPSRNRTKYKTTV